jgi:hypothetical protein
MKLNQIFNFALGKKSKPSEFESVTNNLHDYLGFTKKQRKGLAFLYGMTLPISAFKSKVFDSQSIQGDNNKSTEFILSLLGFYTTSSGSWLDYAQKIDSDFVRSKIYNFNFIYWKCLKQSEGSIDDFLKTIPDVDIIIGKTDLENEWVENFFELSFNLKNVNQLYYDFILSIGSLLDEQNVSIEESYAAGFAFYSFVIQQDPKGSHFLISTLSNSCPPLFATLQEYPVLYTYHRESLNANHIFSSIFHFFTIGIEPSILKPVHTFHQLLFYENGTTEFRSIWDFSKIDNELLIVQTFKNALAIRKTNFFERNSTYMESKQIFASQLIGQRVDEATMFNEVQNVLMMKYGYSLELAKLNSRGEFIELIAMLYYETCLHAMVVDLTDDIH